MTLHAIIKYLHYLKHARGRHGTHSPFVYDFVEQIAQSKETAALPGDKYGKLLTRLADYYHCSIIELPASEPEKWGELLQTHEHALLAGQIIAVRGIHQTIAHTQSWEALCASAAAKMTIDLYGAGLLLTQPEFREKQHFLVKY